MVEIVEEPSDDDEPENQNKEDESSLTPLQKEGLKRTCNSCGGGPRLEKNSGRPIPLKRCSVCQQVWYHDRQCQEKDFPSHKKICKRLLKERRRRQQQQQQEKGRQDLICRVQETTIGKRGRFLVANKRISYGTVIGPKNCTIMTTATTAVTQEKDSEKPHNKKPTFDPHNHWEPIVAPVLLENHRNFRCVVCFGLVLQSSDDDDAVTSTTISSSHGDYYPTKLCSNACKRISASFLPSEQQAISNLSPQHRPPMILPTAILLYRLVLAIERDKSGHVKKILSQLQSERCFGPEQAEDVQETSEEEEAHQQAVCATTWAMMKAITTLPLWNFQDLKALLQQVKLNGFSICTAESVALGIGIYTTPTDAKTTPTVPLAAPNLINHDCRPNLFQTFDYGVVGRYPTLRMTVCVPTINANEELTISYIDNTMPQCLRQKRLLHDYGFRCQCALCQSEANDTTNNSKNQSTINHEDLLRFQSLEDSQALARAYQELKRQQMPTSSWYLHECGERLLQALLDELGACSTTTAEDAQKQYSFAAQAFQLTEELLATGPTTKTRTTTTPKKDATTLRRTILLYKSIKLRLFLNVHPQQATNELETIVLPTCNTFFPGHHELMRQIVQDCCL